LGYKVLSHSIKPSPRMQGSVGVQYFPGYYYSKELQSGSLGFSGTIWHHYGPDKIHPWTLLEKSLDRLDLCYRAQPLRPSDKVSRYLLTSDRKQCRLLTELLTGHYIRTLQWHLHTRALSESTTCKKCGQEEELSYHTLCQCQIPARH
jgi:hypothetical protein